jgi:16S rRNA G966 N2-methylase RsmD
VRIVAGRLKGRVLVAPRGSAVRPTSDSLRETLFNILGATIDAASVVDAFAGTGAVGLEALSRGARVVTFVERDRRALDALRTNIHRCGVESACAIVERDILGESAGAAVSGRARRARAPAGLDGTGPRTLATPEPSMSTITFLDPPYATDDLQAVVDLGAMWTAIGGRLILEHSRRRPSPESAGRLARVRVVTAGDSALSFYD